jgi:aconitate hydratase
LLTTITYADGTSRQLDLLCRIDTEEELSYYRHGGILPFVLRNLANAA